MKTLTPWTTLAALVSIILTVPAFAQTPENALAEVGVFSMNSAASGSMPTERRWLSALGLQPCDQGHYCNSRWHASVRPWTELKVPAANGQRFRGLLLFYDETDESFGDDNIKSEVERIAEWLRADPSAVTWAQSIEWVALFNGSSLADLEQDDRDLNPVAFLRSALNAKNASASQVSRAIDFACTGPQENWARIFTHARLFGFADQSKRNNIPLKPSPESTKALLDSDLDGWNSAAKPALPTRGVAPIPGLTGLAEAKQIDGSWLERGDDATLGDVVTLLLTGDVSTGTWINDLKITERAALAQRLIDLLAVRVEPARAVEPMHGGLADPKAATLTDWTAASDPARAQPMAPEPAPAVTREQSVADPIAYEKSAEEQDGRKAAAINQEIAQYDAQNAPIGEAQTEVRPEWLRLWVPLVFSEGSPFLATCGQPLQRIILASHDPQSYPAMLDQLDHGPAALKKALLESNHFDAQETGFRQVVIHALGDADHAVVAAALGAVISAKRTTKISDPTLASALLTVCSASDPNLRAKAFEAMTAIDPSADDVQKWIALMKEEKNSVAAFSLLRLLAAQPADRFDADGTATALTAVQGCLEIKGETNGRVNEAYLDELAALVARLKLSAEQGQELVAWAQAHDELPLNARTRFIGIGLIASQASR